MDSTAAFAQLQLRFVDQTQWRYEVIRPLVLFADRTATQRAQATATHPDTVRTLHRRFRQQGMPGLLPGDVEVVQRGRASTVPDDVREEINRLKALYNSFHYRELARIVFCKCAYPIDDKTVQLLWQQRPVPTQQPLDLWTYHRYPERYQARLQVVKLYYQGGDKLSISRFLQVSRPPVAPWIKRFEAEHLAGLVDKKRGPKEASPQSLVASDGAGLSSAEGSAGCRRISALEPLGTARNLGPHGGPYHGAAQAGGRRHPPCTAARAQAASTASSLQGPTSP